MLRLFEFGIGMVIIKKRGVFNRRIRILDFGACRSESGEAERRSQNRAFAPQRDRVGNRTGDKAALTAFHFPAVMPPGTGCRSAHSAGGGPWATGRFIRTPFTARLNCVFPFKRPTRSCSRSVGTQAVEKPGKHSQRQLNCKDSGRQCQAENVVRPRNPPRDTRGVVNPDDLRNFSSRKTGKPVLFCMRLFNHAHSVFRRIYSGRRFIK
jgi:hypothetical protein